MYSFSDKTDISLFCSLKTRAARRGIEPLFPPWEGGVLTAWPTSHSVFHVNLISHSVHSALLKIRAARRGIEPLFPPWEGGVLTAWPTSRTDIYYSMLFLFCKLFFVFSKIWIIYTICVAISGYSCHISTISRHNHSGYSSAISRNPRTFLWYHTVPSSRVLSLLWTDHSNRLRYPLLFLAW